MKFNLQFFADEDVSESVEMSEVATPVEVEDGVNEWNEEASSLETEEPTEEVEEPVEEEATEEKPIDPNAIAAAARRRAEAEFKQIQAERDAEFARRFGNYKHPITGKPISSEREYLDAIDAQEHQRLEKELSDKGIDPAMINAMVQNNPVVVQASQFLESAKQQETMNMINADVAELSKMDESIKTFNDVPREVMQYAMDKQVTLVDAYKVVNYGKMSSQKADAIRQSAINQAKSKAHLTPMNGVATNSDNSVEIPQNLRGWWEEAFPNKTWAERKKLYNEQLNQ